MKKSIIIFNIVLLLLLYVSAEFISFYKNKRFEENEFGNYLPKGRGFFGCTFTLPIKNWKTDIKKIESTTTRPIAISKRETNFDSFNINKRSIILYGCSYTDGTALDDNENLSGQLQTITKRLVYNRGFISYGIQHSLYHIENHLKTLKNNNYDKPLPKYVIYTFIEDHLNRLYRDCEFFKIYIMFYKYNKNHSKLIPANDLDYLFWHSYILRTLYAKSKADATDFNSENGKYARKLALDMFIQMKQSLKEQIEDVDFTVFVYDGDIHIKAIEQELKANEINVVYLSELSDEDFTNPKYRLPNDYHPNALAWKVITPLLVKKLNL